MPSARCADARRRSRARRSRCGRAAPSSRARSLERIEVPAARAERAAGSPRDAGRLPSGARRADRCRRPSTPRRKRPVCPALSAVCGVDAGEIDLVRDDRHRAAAAVRGAAPPRASRASGSRTSATHSKRSARATSSRARRTPSRSTGSFVSRRPAVSTTVTGKPSSDEMLAQRIARRAGNFRDDRGVVAREAIQQARLAGVRRRPRSRR